MEFVNEVDGRRSRREQMKASMDDVKEGLATRGVNTRSVVEREIWSHPVQTHRGICWTEERRRGRRKARRN